jgi:N-acetylneuraminate synthase
MSGGEEGVYLIAEAGVNHDGNLGRALELVEVAADAGANAVKFQTFRPEALASVSAAKADYQSRNDPRSESQREMLERLALRFEDHAVLVERCAARGIDFLSSPFDHESARFLVETLHLPRIKLGSGELTNAPLLWQLAASGRALILSTGMASLDEVREALGVCCLAQQGIAPDSPDHARRSFEPERLRGRVTLLHCTSEYPCSPGEVNLRAMASLHDSTGLEVGYSDHTSGIEVSMAAAALGAVVIEKHFTLDRTLPGPDHAASLEPDELRRWVNGIRIVSAALGSAEKMPGAGELRTAAVARKSLVAARPIRRGEPFAPHNLVAKRPGTGLSPLLYWSMIGKLASRDYAIDELIDGPV